MLITVKKPQIHPPKNPNKEALAYLVSQWQKWGSTRLNNSRLQILAKVIPFHWPENFSARTSRFPKCYFSKPFHDQDKVTSHSTNYPKAKKLAMRGPAVHWPSIVLTTTFCSFKLNEKREDLEEHREDTMTTYSTTLLWERAGGQRWASWFPSSK